MFSFGATDTSKADLKKAIKTADTQGALSAKHNSAINAVFDCLETKPDASYTAHVSGNDNGFQISVTRLDPLEKPASLGQAGVAPPAE